MEGLTPGDYTITYTATDAAGNTAPVTRTINVEDGSPPAVSLLGEDSITINCLDDFNDPGATTIDDCDGGLARSPILIVCRTFLDHNRSRLIERRDTITNRHCERSEAISLWLHIELYQRCAVISHRYGLSPTDG